MPAVAALLKSRIALAALRRSLPRDGVAVAACRSPGALHRTLDTRLVDAIVLTPSHNLLDEIRGLRARLPEIPVVAYGSVRPDDGELLLVCYREGVAAVAVEGVDDPLIGDLVARTSASAARRRALADAPRVLRLTEPLQRRAWDLMLREVERPLLTSDLAERLEVSREHLSRQFGAGGAPNLKRVIDLTRIACAAQLLRNPGYSAGAVARLLHFASPAHLNDTARRVAGAGSRDLGTLGPRGVLAAFVKTARRLDGSAVGRSTLDP